LGASWPEDLMAHSGELCTTAAETKPEEGATPEWQPAPSTSEKTALEVLMESLNTTITDTATSTALLAKTSQDLGHKNERQRRKSKELELECYGTSREQAETIEKIFNEFDTQPKDGYIDESELKQALIKAGKKGVTDEWVAKTIKQMDKDGDKKISLDEFRACFLVETE